MPTEFSNQDWLMSRITEYLEKEKIEYQDDNPDPEKISFQFKFIHKPTKLSIIIGQSREYDHRIDVVSVVSFSPEHVDVLKKIPDTEKQGLINDIFFWLNPREPDYSVILNPTDEDPNKDPYYIVILPLYEDEFSLSKLMRNIRLVIKSSNIARLLIQLRLNKFIERKEDENQG